MPGTSVITTMIFVGVGSSPPRFKNRSDNAGRVTRTNSEMTPMPTSSTKRG